MLPGFANLNSYHLHDPQCPDMTNLNWSQTRHLAEANACPLEEMHSNPRPQRSPSKIFQGEQAHNETIT